MKNLSLSILSWGMLISPLAAQKDVTPAIDAYAVNSSYVGKQTINVGGPDTPGPRTSSDLQAASKAPSHEVTVDTTVTAQAYALSIPEQTDPVDPMVPDALFMYPNPTSGIVRVKLIGKISIQIYTISGQLVKKYAMSPGEKFLDLSDLAPGFYQVRAKSDDDYFSGKLLIQ